MEQESILDALTRVPANMRLAASGAPYRGLMSASGYCVDVAPTPAELLAWAATLETTGRDCPDFVRNHLQATLRCGVPDNPGAAWLFLGSVFTAEILGLITPDEYNGVMFGFVDPDTGANLVIGASDGAGLPFTTPGGVC